MSGSLAPMHRTCPSTFSSTFGEYLFGRRMRWEDGRVGIYAMNCMADYLVQYGAGLVDILRRIDKPPGVFSFLRDLSSRAQLLKILVCFSKFRWIGVGIGEHRKVFFRRPG